MALKMSKAAYKKSIELLLQESTDLNSLVAKNIFGLGCTAAIVSSQPKKGPHRCHVASSNYKQHKVFSLELEKGNLIATSNTTIISTDTTTTNTINANTNTINPTTTTTNTPTITRSSESNR